MPCMVDGWLVGCTDLYMCHAVIKGGPWKIFCFLLKFLLKKCYKCRVGSKKSESRGVGWLVGAKSGSEGPVQTYDVCGTLGVQRMSRARAADRGLFY